MKLFIPKSVATAHLLQTERPPIAPPLSGAYPSFHDGARSTKHPREAAGQSPPDLPVAQSIALGSLLSTASQLAYKQLEDMMELLPRMSNIERKQQIIGTCLRLRELFFKLAVLVDFMASRATDLALASVSVPRGARIYV